MKKNKIDVNDLLSKFIKLRQRAKKKNQDPEVIKQYEYYKSLCVVTFEPIVQKLVRKYNQFNNFQDLLQEARIGLLMALKTYQSGKGSFKYWATQYIKIRVSRSANFHSAMHIPLKKIKQFKPHKAKKIPNIIDTAPSALQIMETKEISKIIHAAIKNLSEIEQKIIELNGIKTYSITQISKELNMSPSKCSKILDRAKEKIKKQINALHNTSLLNTFTE